MTSHGNLTLPAPAPKTGRAGCLRCRPETAPELAPWRGESNTVARALRMIEAGALDTADVEALAMRLGLGARQLRRLFKRYLGASPIAVAQTRRILLAKQLLQDTQLPMAEVALAAGFGSIRRFNETFQQLYKRPPRTLRRTGISEEAAAGAVVVKLGYRPPYDWQAVISFLRERAIPGVETASTARYARTIASGGACGILSVEGADNNCLKVTVKLADLKNLSPIVARVRRVFDLAADPAVIGVHLSQDPVLAPLVAVRPGLRVPGAWDGFELAVRTVIEQDSTVSAATMLAGKLAAAFGKPIADPAARELGLSHLFPTPQQLLQADLTAITMPNAQRQALTSLAAAIFADPSIFGPRRSLEEAIGRLRTLSGIDDRTAQYIAMRTMQEPDAFPVMDIGLLRGACGRHAARPSPAELITRAEQWRPWRAYAALHLCASDRTLPKPHGAE